MDGRGFSARGGIWLLDRRARTVRAVFSRATLTATWPSAGLHATRDQVTISVVLIDPLVVTRTNVVSITRVDWIPALGRGLRFEVSDQPDAAVFWTYRRSRIIAELTARGWTVG